MLWFLLKGQLVQRVFSYCRKSSVSCIVIPFKFPLLFENKRKYILFGYYLEVPFSCQLGFRSGLTRNGLFVCFPTQSVGFQFIWLCWIIKTVTMVTLFHMQKIYFKMRCLCKTVFSFSVVWRHRYINCRFITFYKPSVLIATGVPGVPFGINIRRPWTRGLKCAILTLHIHLHVTTPVQWWLAKWKSF